MNKFVFPNVDEGVIYRAADKKATGSTELSDQYNVPFSNIIAKLVIIFLVQKIFVDSDCGEPNEIHNVGDHFPVHWIIIGKVVNENTVFSPSHTVIISFIV